MNKSIMIEFPGTDDSYITTEMSAKDAFILGYRLARMAHNAEEKGDSVVFLNTSSGWCVWVHGFWYGDEFIVNMSNRPAGRTCHIRTYK